MQNLQQEKEKEKEAPKAKEAEKAKDQEAPKAKDDVPPPAPKPAAKEGVYEMLVVTTSDEKAAKGTWSVCPFNSRTC